MWWCCRATKTARSNARTAEKQQRLAVIVDQYNRLMDEQRWPEADDVAKKAAELDPQNPVVQQLLLRSKFTRAYRE